MDYFNGEERLTIEGAFPLEGTLSVPEKMRERCPGILLLPDAGETDRDANTPGLLTHIFKDLAASFAEIGFATLRYDKRGIGKSGGSYFEAGLWDHVDDAVSAMFSLVNHDRVDPERIFLLGYGEGALLASAVNRSHSVQGIVMLAGSALSYHAVLMKKRETTLSEIRDLTGLKSFIFRVMRVAGRLEKNFEAIDRMVHNTDQGRVRYDGKDLNARWMREHKGHNGREALKEISCPVLAIAGSRDIQVPPELVEPVSRLVERVEYRLIEDLNHLLRKDPRQPSMLTLSRDYSRQLQHPIDGELLRIISSWLKNQRG